MALRVLLIFAIAISLSAFANSVEPKLETIAKSKAWLRLLQYGHSWRGHQSRLDGQEFFFAKDGKTNPLSELKASIQGFHEDRQIGRLKLHPQCAFPERFRFIRENFDERYKLQVCPKFKEFMGRFNNPTGISLVFSSAYPNNPASMFGHTFLKIRSDRKSHLLDMGINFAAHTPTNYNMAAFMYKGVAGGYPGLWSMEPYFKKVNEYINAESRDLWEYDLTLTPEETRRVLAHLWELEVTSYFDYYFFDENCSYQVLKAIEAIRLDWDITQHRIYVIPGETVKTVMDQPGAVKATHFRPSLYHQIQIKLARLDKASRKKAIALITQNEADDPSPEVLDTAITGLLYYKAKKKKKWSETDQAWENKILALQAKMPSQKKDLEIPEALLKTRPDWGHHPYSAHYSGSGFFRRDADDNFLGRLKIRSAYHELMSPDTGYASFSEIEFPWIEFKFDQERDLFQVSEIGAFNTTSLFPMSALDQRRSWRVKVALEREEDITCFDCMIPQIEVGYGAAVGGAASRFYALSLLNTGFHPELKKGYRLKPGAELGALWNPKEFYKLRLGHRYFWDFDAKVQFNESFVEQGFSWSRHNELRQKFTSSVIHDSLADRYTEWRLEYIRYFR